MNEIKLRPGEEFVYNGIRFICLDIIDGNYLAIAAECWCESVLTRSSRTAATTGRNPLSAAFLTKMC